MSGTLEADLEFEEWLAAEPSPSPTKPAPNAGAKAKGKAKAKSGRAAKGFKRRGAASDDSAASQDAGTRDTKKCDVCKKNKNIADFYEKQSNCKVCARAAKLIVRLAKNEGKTDWLAQQKQEQPKDYLKLMKHYSAVLDTKAPARVLWALCLTRGDFLGAFAVCLASPGRIECHLIWIITRGML